jgi:LmbE family N-acetylglucosaminyl deacetylase
MTDPLKLTCIFAHPDDETFSAGGILARYAAEGVETTFICATRGERGWAGHHDEYPGLEELGKIREAELRGAAQVLGIREIVFLDTIDGDLDKAPAGDVIGKIAAHLRRIRPQVVVTMDPQGDYGHPDHIALTQFTLAALVVAAAPGGELAPHTVSKLYMVAETQASLNGFSSALGAPIEFMVDGVKRTPTGWQKWAISAEIDTSAYWEQVVAALGCHKTQINNLEAFVNMPRFFPREVWGIRTYYRAFSLVNSGRAKELDLFEGLR